MFLQDLFFYGWINEVGYEKRQCRTINSMVRCKKVWKLMQMEPALKSSPACIYKVYNMGAMNPTM